MKTTTLLSSAKSEVIALHHDYGDKQKPEDYFNAFNQFINASSNRFSALASYKTPVGTDSPQPKRRGIKLDKNAFREQDLKAAWHDVKNEDITARIMGFIRQAAIGEALKPWKDRVNDALKTILALKKWTTPQKNWLKAIAKQTIASIIVDNKPLK